MSCARVSRSSTSAPATLPNAAARPASATSKTHLRFHRSTSAPAGRYQMRKGRVWAKPTSPALAGEPVTASTKSGYAKPLIRVPRVEIVWPLHSSRKSRLRHSWRTHSSTIRTEPIDRKGGTGGRPVVERGFGWLLRYRRLDAITNVDPSTHEAMVCWATVMTRRLAPRSTDPPVKRRNNVGADRGRLQFRQI
jgi:hypothetical protein